MQIDSRALKTETDFQKDIHFCFSMFDPNIINIREACVGNGRIDFIFFYNWKFPVLVEIKLTSNDGWKQGIEFQVTEYISRTKIKYAIYVVIINTDIYQEDCEKELQNLNSLKNESFEIIIIDNYHKKTPSKIKKTKSKKRK